MTTDPARAALAAAALRKALAETGTATLSIRGQSMRPLLPAGCRVVLRPVAPGESLRGAIVAVGAVAGELVIVHRVIDAARDRVVTRGIASQTADSPTPRAQVIGVVRRVSGRPWLGGERTLRALAAASAALIAARRRWMGVR